MNGWLEPAHFFNHYVVPGVPVLFKGAAKQFPAYEKWTDEFFLNHPLAKTSLISLEKGKYRNIKLVGSILCHVHAQFFNSTMTF